MISFVYGTVVSVERPQGQTFETIETVLGTESVRGSLVACRTCKGLALISAFLRYIVIYMIELALRMLFLRSDPRALSHSSRGVRDSTWAAVCCLGAARTNH